MAVRIGKHRQAWHWKRDPIASRVTSKVVRSQDPWFSHSEKASIVTEQVHIDGRRGCNERGTDEIAMHHKRECWAKRKKGTRSKGILVIDFHCWDAIKLLRRKVQDFVCYFFLLGREKLNWFSQPSGIISQDEKAIEWLNYFVKCFFLAALSFFVHGVIILSVGEMKFGFL